MVADSRIQRMYVSEESKKQYNRKWITTEKNEK